MNSNYRTSMMAAAVQRLRARANGSSEADAGFALVFALFIIAILSTASLALAGMILSQTQPTQLSRKNVRTANAASSGLQATLAQLRAANNGSGDGVLQDLPCSSATGATFSTPGPPVATTTASGYTFTGSVSDNPGDLTYSTSVAYYLEDPSSHNTDMNWLNTQALSCPLGVVPYYAFLQSTGQGAGVPGVSATTGDRTQHATYQFRTTNINLVGGRLIEYGSNPPLCLDTDVISPSANAQMHFRPCLALGTPNQTWQYRNDLTIFYGGDATQNLCIQKSSTDNIPTLQPCLTSGSGTTYPYAANPMGVQQAQEWGFNDNGHFAAALSNGTVTNGSGGACLEPSGATASTPAASGALLVTTSCDTSTTGYTAWDPDPQVGAGKAGGNETGLPGPPTKQFVNYKEFGRCLDVTGQNVNADHLIDYPCKQAPDSSTLTWNQLWTYQAVSGGYGIFYTRPSSNYCLTAPTSGTLITTTPCQATPGNSQLWKATGDILGNYPGSFNLVSKSTGKCMGATRTGAITFGSSNIVLETCDGSALDQKWNARSNPIDQPLNNIQEDNGL